MRSREFRFINQGRLKANDLDQLIQMIGSCLQASRY